MWKRFWGGYTPAIPAPGVATLEKVRLGGLDQWIGIRGRHKANPLLLYIAGGPGGTDFGPWYRWNRPLEEHFTVAHWSMRGAGKSYTPSTPPESMTVDQILRDGHELALTLLQRFGQKRLFIAGHSTGSVFALLLAQRYPELVHAHIGINQAIDRAGEERHLFACTLDMARMLGNARAVQDLQGAGEGIAGTIIQRKWMFTFGCITHNPKRLREWRQAVLMAPEQTWADRLKANKALRFSMERLWPELGRFNALEQVRSLQVPVYLFVGRHDRICSPRLAEEWLAGLQAPAKELFVLEQAGHLASFEEPERFNELMITRVLPDTLRR